MKKLGLDLGTKHIVLAQRGDGNKVKFRYEVNGYLVFDKVDNFLEQLLVKQGVPYVTRGDELIAIGKKAEQIAFNFNKTLRRPMAEGGVNKNDEGAQEIIALIIKSIIGKLNDDAVLYYCTTAAPVNSTLVNQDSINFHKKVVKYIIEKFAPDGVKIQAHHINEARCLVLEEPGCAVGISWGAGTVTVHAGIFGVPIFEFSVMNAGDWIDVEVAKQFGYNPERPDLQSRETPTSVCRRKEAIDLSKPQVDRVDQSIKMMYELLIENVVNYIVVGFKQNRDKYKFSEPIPFINAGGTAMPNGFMELLEAELNKRKAELGVPVGVIRKADNTLFAVANGCLLAAELHKE